MAASTPYLGSKISLISNAEIRYEGILYTIDSKESTVALYKVRVFGTEDRKADTPVPPSDDIFEFITFTASDIKDLRVCQPPIAPMVQDPAIVSHSMAPPPGPPAHPGPPGPSFGDFSGTPYANQGPPPRPMYMGGSPFSGGLGLSPASMLAPGANLGGGRGPEPPGPSGPPLPFQSANAAPKVESCAQSLNEGGGSRTSSPDLLAKAIASDGTERRTGLEHEEDEREGQRGGNISGFRGDSDAPRYQCPPPRPPVPREGFHGQRDGGFTQRREAPGPAHGGYAAGRGGGNAGGGNFAPIRGRGGGMGRGSRGAMGGPRGPPRGQLQPNKEPLKFDEDFDFEQANLEFQELESKMAKANISSDWEYDEEAGGGGGGGGDGGATEASGTASASGGAAEDEGASKAASGDEANKGGNGSEKGAGDEPTPEYYNKSKSFFDQISCEALERQKGQNGGQRVDWRHERSINKETFGVAAPPSWGYRNHRGGWGSGYSGNRGNSYGLYRGYRVGGRGMYGPYGFFGNNTSYRGNYGNHHGGGYGSNRSYDTNRNNRNSSNHNNNNNHSNSHAGGGRGTGPRNVRQPQAQEA